MDIKAAINKVINRQDLSTDQMTAVMQQIMMEKQRRLKLEVF